MAAVRYVALGDSLTEGIGDDPWPDGTPRGWADRLAELLTQHDDVEYANLAVRGLRSAQIRDRQLTAALELEPDLVTLTAGMNDILRPRADFDALQTTLTAVVATFAERGTPVLIVPIPDVRAVSPVGVLLNDRRVRLNQVYRSLERHGLLPVVDTSETVFEDPRAWADDRLHLSALGHTRLALAAAAAFGVPVDEDWATPPPGAAAVRTWRSDADWARRHVAPWLGRRVRGRSSGDGRHAKRPALAPVTGWGR